MLLEVSALMGPTVSELGQAHCSLTLTGPPPVGFLHWLSSLAFCPCKPTLQVRKPRVWEGHGDPGLSTQLEGGREQSYISLAQVCSSHTVQLVLYQVWRDATRLVMLAPRPHTLPDLPQQVSAQVTEFLEATEGLWLCAQISGLPLPSLQGSLELGRPAHIPTTAGASVHPALILSKRPLGKQQQR